MVIVFVGVVAFVPLAVLVVVGETVGVGVGVAGFGLPCIFTFDHSEPYLGPGLVALIKSLNVGIFATILFIHLH